MVKSPALKIIRVLVALLFFVPILLFLCDFADVLPDQLHRLLSIQLVPAIMAGSIVTIVALALLTILFGRIYCSTICPMGVIQDFISRLNGRGKKKNKKKNWYQYTKPFHYVRYGILAICTIFLVLGISTPILLLDPYSNFGRVAVNIFRPAVIWGNNLLNAGAIKAGIHGLYHVSIHTFTTAVVVGAIITLLVVFVMSFFKGRLFCNTICPVGSLLGLFSRFSIFRITIDKEHCNHCGSCERACKSECINSKNTTIDNSRCVTCYNCLSRCKQNSIGYQFAWKKVKSQSTTPVTEQTIRYEKQGVDFNRRAFLTTSAILTASIPVIPAWAQGDKDITKDTPITPPGSKNLAYFKEKCTACHLCVTHCPQQILKPAGLTFGFSYLFKPHMVYNTAYCNFECTICSQVCPNKAIVPLTTEEKKTAQVGIAQFNKDRCVVHTEGTDCGACSEHCPTQAVKMMPYKGSLRLPEVTPDLCIGCGGCEYICPVRPIKAINVLANNVHQVSIKPKEEELKDFKVDDFGF